MSTTQLSSPLNPDPGVVVAWATPFGQAPAPSIWPLTCVEEGTEFTAIVYPNGRGRYPAYVVRFESAPVIELSHELAARQIPGWQEAGGFSVRSSSLKWLNSPLAARHGRVGSIAVFDDPDAPMQHFILSGADWIIQVLSTREPTITKHDRPFLLIAPLDA